MVKKAKKAGTRRAKKAASKAAKKPKKGGTGYPGPRRA
jgi:hypothetical protein